VLLAALAVTLHYRNEIDEYAVEINRLAQIAQMAQVDKTKSELIIVSMLNGAIVEDGRLKTICALNAAGVCAK
jgi:phosphomevalonate kinase